MDVYVIEVGQYSDATVIGAASTEERAKEIIAAMSDFYEATDHWFRDEDFNIHKFELDAVPRYVAQTIFDVTYFSHEDHWDASRLTYDYVEELQLNTVKTWNATNSPTADRPAYRVLIAVDDEETALKAGTERILQFIARRRNDDLY
jgi:hypothetical protein